jgi:hypothetical protein
MPPVLRTPNGLRQEPSLNGPDRPSKMEGNAANKISSIKEIEALQQSIISLNRNKRTETLRNKERNLDLVFTNPSLG